MGKELNEQYFKTRQEHGSSYNKRGYLIWVVLGLGLVSFFVVREFLAKGKAQREKTDALKTWVQNGTLSSSDTIISSKVTGTQVLILKNCKYKEFDNGFGAFRADESALTYVTKRLISDADYPSALQQWRASVSSSRKLIYFNIVNDTIEGKIIETADFHVDTSEKGEKAKGKLRLIRKGGLIFALQILTSENSWDATQNDIKRIESSFQILD